MKTLLILDKSLGLAKSRLVKNLLGAAAANAGLTLTEQFADAELAIVLGAPVQADSGLNGKKVFAGDSELALSQPAAFLEQAKAQAQTYQAPAAAVATAAAPAAAKRIVAVTA
ncbi:PTS system fructose-specific transporter subunits IIBC, partial [Dickeya fangzhongdai]